MKELAEFFQYGADWHVKDQNRKLLPLVVSVESLSSEGAQSVRAVT